MISVDNTLHAVGPTAPAAPAPAAPAAPDDSGISFDDLVDVVNPLQHLPVIGTLYRAISGDQIKTFPKLAGDLLYGGPIGFASSIADTIFQKITGKDFGDTVLAKVEDMFSSSDATPTAVAGATPPTKSFGETVLADIESLFSPSAPTAIASATPAQATDAQTPPAAAPTQLAAAPILDTTATSVASNAPALSAPANVTPASLDNIVVPGQDALLTALSRNGISPDTATRAANAYRRSLSIVPANDTLPTPRLRATFAQ